MRVLLSVERLTEDMQWVPLGAGGQSEGILFGTAGEDTQDNLTELL